MEIGKLGQKASPKLVIFVFGCIIVAVGLLYIMQKAEAVAEHISPADRISQLLD